MKKYAKRAAAGILMGVLSASVLAGCSKKIDGTATVVTIDGEEVPMGVVSLLARYQQIKIGEMYTGMLGYTSYDFWDSVDDEETGETYGEKTVNDAAEQIEKMYLLRAKASEYDVTLSDEEQQEIEDAAQAFVDDNEDAVMEKLAATKEDVAVFLELSAYQSKMYDAIIQDVDTNVTDEEAQQTSLTYTKVSYEEDAAEEDKAAKKETAQLILDEVLATADADMSEIAESIDEDSTTSSVNYSTNDEEDETVDAVLKDAISGLKDGEVNASLIEGENCYYIVRLDHQFDEEATESEKNSIISERENDLYNDTLDGWMEEASIEVNKKVLDALTITANDIFVEKVEETEAETTEAETAQEETEAAEAEESVNTEAAEETENSEAAEAE